MTGVISNNINANNTPTHFQAIPCQTNKQKWNFQPKLMHNDSALYGQYAQSYGHCKVTAFDKGAWILKSVNHHYFKTNKLNQYGYLYLWYPVTSNFEANQWRIGLWAVLAWHVTGQMHNVTECIYKFMCSIQITILLPVMKMSKLSSLLFRYPLHCKNMYTDGFQG